MSASRTPAYGTPRAAGPGALPRERLAAALKTPARGTPALVAYLTAGFPSRERFRDHLLAIAEVADAVEVGVPFSDPMADGVTIQRASEQALRLGVTLRWILEELATLPPVAAPLLLMSYLNPLLAYGPSRLAADAARSGVCGFIVPDLPFEESAELAAALSESGLALVQMVTPVTASERLGRICAASQGFVYAVTRTGTTGRSLATRPETRDYLRRVRAAAQVPVCAGFGIRTREQVDALRSEVDGVIIGSALIEVLEAGHSAHEWLAALRAPIAK